MYKSYRYVYSQLSCKRPPLMHDKVVAYDLGNDIFLLFSRMLRFLESGLFLCYLLSSHYKQWFTFATPSNIKLFPAYYFGDIKKL